MIENAIGLDPGFRYTGVSVRDFMTEEILLSSTYVRPEEMALFTWAILLADTIEEEVIQQFPGFPIGIEGVTAPTGFSGGKKALLNPKYIIFTGVVAGALAARYPDSVIVKPGHNGTSRAGYPPELEGRRPKTLPGSSKAGTRNHERSAYDVAGAVPMLLSERYKLDSKTELL